jgi:Saxitoxin biosynthesis operon protein SxtJ
MRWSDIQFDPPPKVLRQFAGLWILFVGALAVWQMWARGRIAFGGLLMLAAVIVGTVGLIRPVWIRAVYVGLMVLTFPIGWTISHIILLGMFFGLFAPLGLAFRLLGRDTLRLARRNGLESYWEPKSVSTDLRRYFKQF